MIKCEGIEFTKMLFKDIDKEELTIARRVMEKMLLNINEIDNKEQRVVKNDN